MRIVCFLLILISLTLSSCDYFSFKKPVKKEIPSVDSIDFSKVDEFPIFPECDSIPSIEKQRICFQLEMSKYIYQALDTLDINAKVALNDTLIVKIIVDKNGYTKLSSIQKSDYFTQKIPKIDSIINASLKNLPKLQPAIKRGIPVDAEFSLPILIKTD